MTTERKNLSHLRSELTGERLTDTQYECRTYTYRKVGDIIQATDRYRVIAAGPIHLPFAQLIVIEEVE